MVSAAELLVAEILRGEHGPRGCVLDQVPAAVQNLLSDRHRLTSVLVVDGTSAASRKYPGIRAPLHPLQLVAQVRRTLPVRLHLRVLLARRIDALDASGYLRDATLLLAKRLVEVRRDVVHVLETHRKTDEVVRDAGGELLRRGELLVRRGRRVDHEALRVADVRQMGEELRLSMNFFPAATPPLMPNRGSRRTARGDGTSSRGRTRGGLAAPGS